MDTKPKHAGGRPTKYRKEYCQRIVELGQNGDNPLVSLACELTVAKSTVQDWFEAFPEFGASYQTAKAACEQFWLNLSKNRASGSQVTGSDTMIKFMLSAAHGYREKTDVTSEINQTTTIVVQEFGQD